MDIALAMALAMLLDLLLGWPDALYQRIGHPVTWIGRLISLLETRLNRGQDAQRRLAGVAILILVVTVSGGLALLASKALPHSHLGTVLLAFLAWPFLAIRSLHDHVQAVARPLEAGDLAKARLAVSMIVGRNPDTLDEAGITRASLESLAENTSDGIIAPLFWGVLLGLPGLVGYKAVNTLDSMIGHKTARYHAFGWASARFDDLVNLGPARLSGLLFALTSPQPRRALNIMMRDAGHHRSPNAGWPEAALAGGLDIRLSGPRIYDGRLEEEPWVHAGGDTARAGDIDRGLKLYRRVMLAAFMLVFGTALLV